MRKLTDRFTSSRCTRLVILLLISTGQYTHATLDPARYAGRWYTQYYTDNLFDSGTQCQQSDYHLLTNGDYRINATAISTSSSKRLVREGRAHELNAAHTQWSVHFHWPFWGESDIVYHDPRYQYAIITTPNHHYAWINSRTRKLTRGARATLLRIAKDHGLPMTRLTARSVRCS